MKVTKGGTVSRLLKSTKIPKMFHARQTFPKEAIRPEEIPQTINQELSKKQFASLIQPGMSVAITAGSRGIRNVDIITKAIVDFVKSRGGCPFIVPAEGQKEILASYNITEESMGCEIRSSMEVVELGYSERGRKVVLDKNAYEADGIIVSCRLKPHNAFRGEYESGPCKMMTVGLGKQIGAETVHTDGMDVIAQNIPTMAKVVLEKAKILFAVPCIENAYDETCKIEAILAKDIMEREPQLLKFAFSNMPKLIVGEGDVLVVDEIGKNYSGTGVEKMYPNCITSTVLASARIPCVVATDKEAIQICIRSCNKIDKEKAKVVRIPNSLHIGNIMLSESYYEDVKAGRYPGVEALDAPAELEFDQDDNIITPIII